MITERYHSETTIAFTSSHVKKVIKKGFAPKKPNNALVLIFVIFFYIRLLNSQF